MTHTKLVASSFPTPVMFMLIGLLSAVASAADETLTVNIVADVVDFASPQTVAQLPGPDGKTSMREAVLAANNTAGAQTIAFALPASELWLVDDTFLLQNEGSAWFVTDDQTVIDFTTQEATTDINPDGNEIGVYGTHPSFLGQAAIAIPADHCIVKGLGSVMQRGYGVDISGNFNRVIGCTISGPLYAGVRITGGFGGPSSTGNIVGGTEPGDGNFLSSGNAGVRIDGPAHENIVIGNVLTGVFQGAQVRTATCCPGLEAINNRIGGLTAAERNIISGAGKYGEEGFPTGEQVEIEYATGTIIEGNYIGTNEDGTAAAFPQRGPSGVMIRSAPGTIVRDNLISGIRVVGVDHYEGDVFGTAVDIEGGSPGTVIEGNRIGVQADRVNPLPNHFGVAIFTFPGTPLPTNITIGGDAAGEGNLVAFNDLEGVRLITSAVGNPILGNDIHSNGALGIELVGPGTPGTGVTPNDPGDLDSGANRLQNFPVITSAVFSGSSIQMQGTLNSTADSAFRVELFRNVECDPSGHGEGQFFLGFTTMTTDGSGNGSFTVAVPAAGSTGAFVTATATNITTNDTSEFSACDTIQGKGSDPEPADLDGDGDVDGIDLAQLLAAWGPCSGACAADLDGNGIVNGVDLAMLLSKWT